MSGRRPRGWQAIGFAVAMAWVGTAAGQTPAAPDQPPTERTATAEAKTAEAATAQVPAAQPSVAQPSVAQPSAAPPADPPATPFARRLDALIERLQGAAADEGLAGVLAVGLAGEAVRVAPFGRFAADDDRPMTAEALFALDTLTQPVVAVGALMLQERGHWLLGDRLGRYLPAFASSDVTLVDLLRQSSGLAGNLVSPGRVNGGDGYAFDHSLRVARSLSAESFVRVLATARPDYGSGQVARPGFDYDLLGLALAARRERPLGVWLLSELFVPLELWDLGFHLDGDRADRFVGPPKSVAGDPRAWRRRQDALGFDCGGACLVGTAADVLRFGQWLLAGGEWNGTRLLSRESVALMTRDHLRGRTENRIGLPGMPVLTGAPAAGYGFGVGLVGAQGLPDLPAGENAYGVASPLGHLLWVDPDSGLVIVLLARAPSAAAADRYARLTLAMTYGARP